ncbi:MAG: Hint 2 protein [Dehalococcoidia bacterium]|nr:Hint 2 protein [Dehalococcoidia bacterium]
MGDCHRFDCRKYNTSVTPGALKRIMCWLTGARSVSYNIIVTDGQAIGGGKNMKKPLLAILMALLLALSGCGAPPSTTPPVIYSAPELKYRLISNFGDLFYVDRDFYPVAREGQEEKSALEQFPGIRADAAEFSAILEHLALPSKADYTNEEKLLIYREHKKLALGVEMTTSGDAYHFILRVGEGQGQRIEGTITPSGKITVLKKEPSSNTYPICLARGTLIDTPDGPVPVEQLRQGMAVWTVNEMGERTAAVVARTVATPVPPSFQVVRVRLNDSRTVTASWGHPTAEGRALGDYHAGDTLDGALVAAVEQVTYEGGATYDLLPSGMTGLYWANGILLKSTLATN